MWKLVSGSLLIKFYLWFLLALTVTTLTAVVAAGMFFAGEFRGRFEERILSEARMTRDVTRNLLHSGLDPQSIVEILQPVAHREPVRLTVLRADQSTLLHIGAEGPLPSQAHLAQVLSAGEPFSAWEQGGLSALLPIDLPGGESGVFFLALSRHGWREIPHRAEGVAVLVMVLGVLWLLCWPLARHLARPLRQMADAAQALGAGDLGARIHIRRHDEIGRLAQRLNTMADSLERMVRSHKQLLADISHELRSPLARLRVALGLVRQDAGPVAEVNLERAERQADALDGLIGELLTYSRFDAAPYAPRFERGDPAQSVDLVLQACAEEAAARGVRIEATPVSTPAGGLPPLGAMAAVRYDPTLLERALGNVLGNAIAHSAPGGAVQVASHWEGDLLRVDVSDAGPGVPEGWHDRIFEPFQRPDTARRRETGGVGLGLAIARRCMEAHGGGASAEPGAGGQGLTVHLWLRASAAAAAAADTATDTAAAADRTNH